MAKKGKKKSKGAYRPLYRAPRKKKVKFPAYLKQYYACRNSGKSKSFCKKKYIPKK